MAGVPFVPLPEDAPLPAATNADAEDPDLEGHVMLPVKACADMINAVGPCGDRLLWTTQNFGQLIPPEIKRAIDEVGNRLNTKVDEFDRVVQGCPRYEASLPCVGVLTPHRGPVTAEMESQREAALQDLSNSGLVDVTAEGVVVEVTGMGTADALVEEGEVEATDATAGAKRARKGQGKGTGSSIRRSANFDFDRMDSDVSDGNC